MSHPERGGTRKSLFKSEIPSARRGKLYQSDTSEQVENTKVNAEIRLRNSAKRLNTFARMSSYSKRGAREEAYNRSVRLFTKNIVFSQHVSGSSRNDPCPMIVIENGSRKAEI